MLKKVFTIDTWGLNKRKAITKANAQAHPMFASFIKLQRGQLENAELSITGMRRTWLCKYNITYTIKAQERPRVCVVTYKEPSKKKIKKTPKKVYKKRDAKGRFTK